MSEHRNNVANAVSGTPGTGTITLASAVSGSQSFSTAYGANATVDVFITDGTAWEVARNCTYTHSGTTLSRGTLEASSTGSAISLTSAAVVRVAATAASGNEAQAILTQADRCASYGFQVTGDGSTTQTLTDATYVLLHGGSGGAFRAVEWNVGSIWSADSNGIVTLPDGRWQFYAQMTIKNVAANQRVFLGLYKNAALHRMLGRTGGQGSTTQSSGTGGTCCVESDGDDQFDLRCYVDGSGTHDAELLAPQCYFGCEYLGPRL
ncbi:MAG: hypothetical protein KAY54_01730 [Burkholderiaceae bacterium]|nr:hypothetical protein [Burkholderiaceae bacterium]